MRLAKCENESERSEGRKMRIAKCENASESRKGGKIRIAKYENESERRKGKCESRSARTEARGRGKHESQNCEIESEKMKARKMRTAKYENESERRQSRKMRIAKCENESERREGSKMRIAKHENATEKSKATNARTARCENASEKMKARKTSEKYACTWCVNVPRKYSGNSKAPRKQWARTHGQCVSEKGYIIPTQTQCFDPSMYVPNMQRRRVYPTCQTRNPPLHPI